MNYNHLCIKCMKITNDEKKCQHCGHYHEDTAPKDAVHLKPGTVLNNRYIIGKALGDGGFGITYIGFDKSLHVRLAIKEFFPHHLCTRRENSDELVIRKSLHEENFNTSKEKFLVEARTIAQFHNHPNIIETRDYFEANNTAYMVMEYLEGIPLDVFLEDKGKLEFRTALKIIVPVFNALKDIHAVDLLHRDISPDNIYLTYSGEIKIFDFGSARYTLGDHPRTMTLLLKEGYAPLEQYSTKGNQGPWTDIYATAATLYEMLTAETVPGAMDRITSDTLASPSALGVFLPSYAEKVILKALSMKAKQRYQTIKDFEKALTKGKKIEGTFSFEDFEKSKTEPVVIQEKKRVSLLISLGSVAAILLFFVIIFTNPAKDYKPKHSENISKTIKLPGQLSTITKKQYASKSANIVAFTNETRKPAGKKAQVIKKSKQQSVKKKLKKQAKKRIRPAPQKPEIVKKLSPERQKLLDKCSQSIASSCYKLAYYYEKGIAGPIDKIKAEKYYTKSCNSTYATACHNAYGLLKHKQPDKASLFFKKTVTYYEKSCNNNKSDSCLLLGKFMLNENRETNGKAKGANLIKKSCDLGNATACYLFGELWLQGNILKKNKSIASIYFKKACNLGYAKGCVQ